MIATHIARLAMAASLLYYAGALAVLWGLLFLGNPEVLWDSLDIDLAAEPPTLLVSLAACAVTVFMLAALGVAYWSIDRILNGGRNQDFLLLSHRLRRTSLGLMGFWLGFNLFEYVLPWLVTRHLPAGQSLELTWDPLDVAVVFLIVAIALFAIAGALTRAWEVEEENRQFL